MPAPAAKGSEAIVTLKETSKKDQKCKVVRVYRTTDGKTAYDLQVVATGERITIYEGSASTDADRGGLRGMAARLFSRNRDQTATLQEANGSCHACCVSTAPAKPVAANSTGKSATAPLSPYAASKVVTSSPGSPTQLVSAPPISTEKPASATALAPSAASSQVPTVATDAAISSLAPATAAAQAGVAPPTDWHQSWGKADDHKSHRAALVQLPQADPNVKDPLKDPESLNQYPFEKKSPAAAKAGSGVGTTQDPPGTAMPVASTSEAKSSTKPGTDSKSSRGFFGMVRSSSRSVASTRPADPAPMVAPGAAGPESVVIIEGTPAEGMIYTANAPNPNGVGAQAAQPAPRKRSWFSGFNFNTPPWETTQPDTGNAFTPAQPRQPPRQEVNAFAGVPADQAVAMVQEVYPPSPYGNLAQHMPMRPPMARRDDAAANTGMVYASAPNSMMVPPDGVVMTVPTQVMMESDTSRMLQALQFGPYPSQREWAVEGLAASDWRHDPTIVPALVKAAREDPAATVRAACVRCLVKVNTGNRAVMAVVESLKADPDARVRQEVDIALANQPAEASTAQPVGLVLPPR
jgi:hypothetical protein